METLFDDNDDTYGVSELKPGIGEHWKVKHGQNFLYALIVTESPLSVQYFEPSAKGKNHILSDTVFEVLLEDLDGKVESPSMVKKGRRTFSAPEGLGTFLGSGFFLFSKEIKNYLLHFFQSKNFFSK